MSTIVTKGDGIFNVLKNIKNIEVEYKINSSNKFEIILYLLKEFKKNPKIKMDLVQLSNVIYSSPDKKSYRFNKNYSTKEKYYDYKELVLNADIENINGVKLSVNVEEPIKTLPKTLSKTQYIVRIKNRLSFEVGNWNFDFTILLELKSGEFNEDLINYHYKILFDKYKSKNRDEIIDLFVNSLAEANSNSLYRIEFEIEYRDKNISENIFDELGFIHDLAFYNIEIISYFNESLIISKLNNILGGNNRKRTIKEMLPSAKTLTRPIYNSIFPPIGYYLSRKADGDRCLFFITKQDNFYIYVDRIININNSIDDDYDIKTIIEGELVGKDILFYDIIMNNGTNVTNLSFKDRLVELAKCVDQIIKIEGYKFSIKPAYMFTEDIKDTVNMYLKTKFPYTDDGAILTSPGEDYFNTENYKIKESNTIDFVIKKLDKRFYGSLNLRGKNIYMLFAGSNEKTIEKLGIKPFDFIEQLFGVKQFTFQRPIQFVTPDYPKSYVWDVPDNIEVQFEKFATDYPNKNLIVELKRDFAAKEWKLVRIRYDRLNEQNYYGNNFVNVALINWMIDQNPIKIEDLHLSVLTYFNKGKDDRYYSQTTCMSMIKNEILRNAYDNIADKKEIVAFDMAAGKGQDLGRYIKLGIGQLLVSDIDYTALNELLTRYYNLVHNKKENLNMKIGVIKQDFTENHSAIIDKITNVWESTNFNLIVCNLAIHYFIKDLDELRNVIMLVKKLLVKGGTFVFTTFDGKNVFDATSVGDEWVANEGDFVKYHIKRLFKSKIFSEFYQQIELKLPFTVDEYYKENLVNLDLVIDQFNQYGFKLIERNSFSKYLPHIKNNFGELHRRLSPDDIKFISLYSYVILTVE